MKIARHAAVFAAVAGLLVTTGNAQLASTYSGFSGEPRRGTSEEFWFALSSLGQCFARMKTEQSRALLATQPASAAEAKAVREMLGRQTGCLRHASRITMRSDLLRGAIIEGLYKRDVRAPVAAVEVPRPAAVDPRSGDEIEPFEFLAEFARCFASKHPQRVHRLVTETHLGTAKSHAAIAEFEPIVPECLPPNARMQFEPTDIRLALVEALYRRSVAVPPVREGSR